MNKYFYGPQSDLFSFYRIPKVLFQYERYRELSAEAKVLYGLLLDRMDLSAKNNWMDEKGKIYIVFTVDEIQECLNCGNKKACQLLSELENKGHLIERCRQGLGKPNLIYVLNFIELDTSDNRHFQKCQNDTSGSVIPTSLEVSKRHGNNTDYNNTDMNDTESILSDPDGMDRWNSYSAYFRDKLEIEMLLQQYPTERETLQGIPELLADVCATRRDLIRIAGDDKPAEVVKNRFMKLDSSHIQYVLECLRHNNSEVRNIRQYLLSALYNAPITISPYYRAQVNHDMSEGLI